MNIVESVKQLFPDAINGIDFIVRDDSDGKGPYLDEWNIAAVKPSKEDLQTAWNEIQAQPPQPVPSLSDQLAALQKQLNDLQAQIVNS